MREGIGCIKEVLISFVFGLLLVPSVSLAQSTSVLHALWNGYLEQDNILELFNPSDETISVDLTVYTQSGDVGATLSFDIASLSQRDIILNDLLDIKDAYGLVRVEYSGDVRGRMMFYRDLKNDFYEDHDYVFGVPLLAPKTGITNVGFNTFHPSQDYFEKQNNIPNWLTIVNLDSSDKRFTVYKYDQVGTLLSTERVKVSALGRVDVDGGHLNPGRDHVGLNVIVPDDLSAPYRAMLIRYGPCDTQRNQYDEFGNFYWDVWYRFAFPLDAIAGYTEEFYVPLSTRYKGANWLEVINLEDTSSSVRVEFYSANGTLLETRNLSLGAYSQLHINAAEILGSEEVLGHAKIIPSSGHSTAAQSMFYFYHYYAIGQTWSVLASMYGTQGALPGTTDITGTFNSFLSMYNVLRMVNPYDESISVSVTTAPVSGGGVSREVAIGANSTVDLILDAGTSIYEEAGSMLSVPENIYGTVQITDDGGRAPIAEIIRQRHEGVGTPQKLDFTAPTAVE